MSLSYSDHEFEEKKKQEQKCPMRLPDMKAQGAIEKPKHFLQCVWINFVGNQ